MKKRLVFFILCYSVAFAYAQPEDKLKLLVDAEWSFINLAKETNTRDAFWAQFTDETVVFGEGPVNAKKAYEKQRPNNGWLKWEPVFSDIAASGDFGYNTGPWEFRTNKTDEKAVAFGQFVSFWKQQKDGFWKLLIDIGINHPQPKQTPTWQTSRITTEKLKEVEDDVQEAILVAERNFLAAYVQNATDAYKLYLSDEARIYLAGKEPVTDIKSTQDLLAATKVKYNIVGAACASSGDLGYVYGTGIMPTASSPTKAVNYLRIWKHEKDNDWKIVLDLITHN